MSNLVRLLLARTRRAGTDQTGAPGLPVVKDQAALRLTHQHLLREVWGPGSGDQHHYLRVYMAQLRHKLEQEPARPRHLVTEPGVGYRLRED